VGAGHEAHRGQKLVLALHAVPGGVARHVVNELRRHILAEEIRERALGAR
jgi:hypothetical protein